METYKYDFLDNNCYINVNAIREEYKEYYELVFMIVSLIDLMRDNEQCKSFKDDREKYIIATLWECYSTYSSELLLLERGLLTDFHVLLRTFYEKKFKFFAVIKHRRNYNKILDDVKYYSTNLANSIIENQYHIFDDYQELIDKDKYDFTILQKKQMSVEAWANKAGLISDYYKQYALLSEKTHYGLGSIVDKFEINDGDNVTYLTYSYDGFKENIVVASYEMFLCILKFFDFKNVNSFQDQINIINNKISELCKNSLI